MTDRVLALSPDEFIEAQLGGTLLRVGVLVLVRVGELDAREAKRALEPFRSEWRYRHKPRIVVEGEPCAGALVWTWPGGAQVTTTPEKMVPPRFLLLGTLDGSRAAWTIRCKQRLHRTEEKRLSSLQRQRALRALAGQGAGP